MRVDGHIAVCGMISQYNLNKPVDIQNLLCLINKRIHMKGFSVRHYFHMYPKFLDTMLPYIGENKIVYIEDMAEGLDYGLAALVGLFAVEMS